jgi:hypothetical protein
VENPDNIAPSEELANFQWTTIAGVKKRSLEHWSRLALMLVDPQQSEDGK